LEIDMASFAEEQRQWAVLCREFRQKRAAGDAAFPFGNGLASAEKLVEWNRQDPDADEVKQRMEAFLASSSARVTGVPPRPCPRVMAAAPD
jgi:hypothetical protein